MEKDWLAELHRALINVHKRLLEWERHQYEGKYGAVGSPGKMFELVTGHPDFAWVRTLSELIVSIDTLMDDPESDGTENLVAYTRTLLQGSPEGSSFSQRYHLALHNDPAVALAHGKVRELLNTIK